MADQIQLNAQEEQELQEGQALYEMSRSPGFLVLQKWLEDMAYHAWVDPRATSSEKEWMWQELNAFHGANLAKELLERLQKAVSQAEYLQKKKSGEIKRPTMRF